MMRQNLLCCLIFLSFSILFVACKSAADKYKDKNYIGAFEDALKDLKKEKDKKENLSIIRKSLVKLVSEHKIKYSKLNTVGTLEDKAKIADSSIDLLDRLDRARNFIIADSFYNVNLLTEQTNSIKLDVGNGYLKRAKEALENIKTSKNKSLALIALNDAEKSEYYGGLSSEIKTLKDDIYKYGTTNVNLEVDQWGSQLGSYEVNRVFRNIEGFYKNRLLNVVYDRNSFNDMDCNMRVKIDPSFNDYNNSNTLNFTEQVEDGFDVKKDANGKEIKVKRYKTVSGSVRVNSTTTRLSANVDVDVRSFNNNCNFRSNRWNKYVESINETYTTSGDQRAIPSRYRNGSNNNTKSRSQLEEELIREIYDSVVREYFQ